MVGRQRQQRHAQWSGLQDGIRVEPPGHGGPARHPQREARQLVRHVGAVPQGKDGADRIPGPDDQRVAVVTYLGHGRRTGILLHQAQPQQQLHTVRVTPERVLDLREKGVQTLRDVGARHLARGRAASNTVLARSSTAT